MSDQDPLVGLKISHYDIVARIGEGAMGVVYRARHDTLERQVAIKFLAAHLSVNTDYVARFLREARAAAKLHHSGLIAVHDAGTEDGIYYIVMEYVEGYDLARLLKNNQVFTQAEVVRHGLKAAEALAYAHQHNIIHRDIKPENLILTSNGEIKVADLGLAKQLDDPDASVTMAGTVVGTPYYVSPEQIRGDKDIDARADIYSLGVTLFHLITRRPPFEGESSADIMSKHLTEASPTASDFNSNVSPEFSRVLLKMMAKEVKDRFQSMEEVRVVLDHLAHGRIHKIAAMLGSASPVESATKPSSPTARSTKRTLRVPEAPSTQAVEGIPVATPISPSVEDDSVSAKSQVSPWIPPALKITPEVQPAVKLQLKNPAKKPPEEVKILPGAPPPTHIFADSPSEDVGKPPKTSTSFFRALGRLVMFLAAFALIYGGYSLLRQSQSASAVQKPPLPVSPRTPPPSARPKLSVQDWLNAARKGDLSTLQTFLNKGVDIQAADTNGWTALLCATHESQIETVRWLLEHQANTAAIHSEGRTALMEAASRGDVAILSLLLQNGAAVDGRGLGGRTALMEASSRNHTEAMTLLLEKGSDINAINSNGWTALMDAASDDNKTSVDYLLAKGADVNIRSKSGYTPLMWAAKNGNRTIVELLLSKGADVNAHDIEGKSVLSLADPKVKDILKAAGARE